MSRGVVFRPVFWAALFLAAGVACGDAFRPEPAWFFLCAGGVSLPFALFGGPRRFRVLFAAGCLAAGIGIERVRAQASATVLPPEPARILGQIVSFPSPSLSSDGSRRWRFRFRVRRWLVPDRPGNETLWVSVPSRRLPARYGDVLVLDGQVLSAGPADFPGGWDGARFLAVRGLDAVFAVRDVSGARLLGPGDFFRSVRAVGDLKQALRERVDAAVPAPGSALVQALLLGEQDEIPASVRDAFAKSGTAHLLAISGGNVALILLALTAALRAARLSPRSSSAAVLAALPAYVLLTGCAPSVVRASVMAAFVLLGSLLRREAEWLTACSWSAILILLWDPFQLFDAGFQLSYLSVLSIGTLVPQKAEEEPGARSHSWVRFAAQAFQVSCAAWIGVLPWTARLFCLCDPVAPLANLGAVPSVAALLAGSLALAALGPLHSSLANLFGAACDAGVCGVLWFCRTATGLPGAWVRVIPPSIWFCAAYYAALAWWIFGTSRDWGVARRAIPLLAVLSVWIWPRPFPPHPNELKTVFIDVGHGDAALVELPGGANLLVDAGPGLLSDEVLRTVAPLLWSRGVFRLDAVAITHPHEDHYGGLRLLLREFPVAAVIDNGDRSCRPYERLLAGSPAARLSAQAGDDIRLDPSVRIRVLHPSPEFMAPGTKTNDQSLALEVRYGTVSFLLAGDAEESALDRMAETAPAGPVLKVPHHGSDEGEAERRFLRSVRPEVAVISEGRENRYGLPSPRTRRVLESSGARVYQTGLDGDIEASTDGSAWSARSLRAGSNPPLSFGIIKQCLARKDWSFSPAAWIRPPSSGGSRAAAGLRPR